MSSRIRIALRRALAAAIHHIAAKAQIGPPGRYRQSAKSGPITTPTWVTAGQPETGDRRRR